MEAEIAIGQLAARFPKMRLATTRVKWMKGLTFRGVKELVGVVEIDADIA